ANPAFFAEFTVFTCPIDSIDQSGLRLISMWFFLLFNRVPHPGPSLVGIPRQQIQKAYPLTRLTDSLAPNSTRAFVLPRTIGRTCGWLMLTIQSSMLELFVSNIIACWRYNS